MFFEHLQRAAGAQQLGRRYAAARSAEEFAGVVPRHAHARGLARCAVRLQRMRQPAERREERAARRQFERVAPFAADDVCVVARVEQVARAKHSVASFDFAQQRLPNEAGEQGGAPTQRRPAFTRLGDQQAQVERRAEEIELRRAAQLRPEVGAVRRAVRGEEVFDLAVGELFDAHVRHRTLRRRQRCAVVEAAARKDRAHAMRQAREEVAP